MQVTPVRGLDGEHLSADRVQLRARSTTPTRTSLPEGREQAPSPAQSGDESGLDGAPLSIYKKTAADTPRHEGETRKAYRARVLAKVRAEIKDKKENPRAVLAAAGGARGKGRGKGKPRDGAASRGSASGGTKRKLSSLGATAKRQSRARGRGRWG